MHFNFTKVNGGLRDAPELQAVLPGVDNKGDQWKVLVWILIGLGIFFRLFHYLYNRSLWVDEVYLASSLIRMNFWELTAPALDYEQKAPIGFLWLVRLAVVLFGKSEFALRFIPLLSGIAALILFVPLCRYFLKPLGVVVAVGIMALASPLVYHAVETKQYSTELFATVTALYLYTRYHDKRGLLFALQWGFWGAVIIWFSYASIFILAGMAGGLGLYYLLRKDWAAFAITGLMGIVWLLSFTINYFLFTNKYADSEWLVIWFRNEAAFMPLVPASLADLKWFGSTLYKALFYPLGLLWQANGLHNRVLQLLFKLPLLPLFFLATGLWAIFRQNRKFFWVLIFPLGLTLLASGLDIYPFYERLLVFLAPPLILFIAWGGDYLTRLLPDRHTRWRYILPLLLLAIPLASSAAQVINPHLFGGYKKAYHRETLFYVNDRFKPGDVVYVYWNVQHTYRFYKEAYNLKFNAIQGKDMRYSSSDTKAYFRNLEDDFDALRGKKRVWVIYNKFYVIKIGDIVGTPAYYYADLINGKKLHAKFLTMGKVRDSYKTLDVNVSLFDFSAN
ncbi:MAG: hypothetical protein JWQ14_1342 [Adhaeribacter sp.]|nr:hypothetical protein [Adhaeribacter sp.]